jgi:catechol 2,3-dioxygenase-like lactoylglutathione lyase family enzyme
MANRFGADILIQASDPKKAALFYVNHLGFEITDKNPKMIGLHGQHINLFYRAWPALGTGFGSDGRQLCRSETATRRERL